MYYFVGELFLLNVTIYKTLETFIKGHLLCFFFAICNISLWCPQNVSVKFQLKIPHRSFIISFRKCLFRVEAESCYFRACLFKCKWAAAPRPLFQNRTVPLQLVPHISAKKNIYLVLIIMSIALKSCILSHGCVSQKNRKLKSIADPLQPMELWHFLFKCCF